MQTRQIRLLDALADPEVQYIVPVYQRVYSWTRPHCEALLRDSLVAAYEDRPHFVGTLLYRDGGTSGGVRERSLIDGQQRLATTALLALALRDRMARDGLDVPEWLGSCLAVEADDGPRPKIVLSRPDEATFSAIMLGGDFPEVKDTSELVIENASYFAQELADPDLDARALADGLSRLTVVAAELGPEDHPQLVFESLNAKGMPLKTSDLIRNLLLTQLDRDEQVRLFKRYWEPLENRFDAIEAAEKAEREHKIGIPPQDRKVEWEGLALDAALHAWLIEESDTARPATRAGLYDAFKNHVAEHPEVTLEELLRSINASCSRFADEFDTPEAKEHIDWAIGKAEGFGGR